MRFTGKWLSDTCNVCAEWFFWAERLKVTQYALMRRYSLKPLTLILVFYTLRGAM